MNSGLAGGNFRSTVTAPRAQTAALAAFGQAVPCTRLAGAAVPAVTKNVDSSTKNAEMALPARQPLAVDRLVVRG
ncbi:hypothetical protein RFM41_13385 [Mesorhizobium sp. VK25A]|uniref:Uncharacterized protein n=1 Tax=Mesorhizobium vachelliae TaxID=3072309 RepID=A0ABU5A4Y7_9HYPH|nr:MULTISPECIES: hypothetical protein [unclassified Mesorhizobium]MDX8532759.1 hypothetical protein [Mesorhizobium sp. VK25D]MDX8544735.1 hypothetical protein [Mesorhizobium sp. VK25A]